MKIVAVKILREFWIRFPDSEQHLKSWVDEVKQASWTQPADIKDKFRSASILKNRRVVFNIKGNDSIAAVTKVMKDEEEEAIAVDGEELEIDPNAVLEDDSDEDDDVVDDQEDVEEESDETEE